MVRRTRKSQVSALDKVKEFFISSKLMPLIFAFSVIGIMYVLIRMKGIEQDYTYNDIDKRVKIQKIQNKELKAKRARELSMKKLKAFAKKFELNEPDEKRIIVIP